MITALRGMKDLLPPENQKYQYFVTHASRIARRYGFDLIETPILEETALFKRSVGESSDIVGKEMYQFVDKGDNDVCMRPEGTAGVVRAFIEAKYDRVGGTYRFFYHGPMYRYERPQKGRLRQFHQFGCEVFGESNVTEDASLILMIRDIFDFFGIRYAVKINSLGCPSCMPGYKQTLVSHLNDISDGLCEDCNRRIAANPLRVLDCKTESCKTLLTEAPILRNHLCETCAVELETLCAILDRHAVPYEIDSKLVRGLDYYSKTAFEFTSPDIGAQSAIAGGGRYDRLVEFLGGKPTAGIGFAIGIERIMDLITLPEIQRDGIYLGGMIAEAIPALFDAATHLRKSVAATVGYEAKGLKGHLKSADRANARWCAVIGGDEWAAGTVWVKDLVTKEERTVAMRELILTVGAAQ